MSGYFWLLYLFHLLQYTIAFIPLKRFRNATFYISFIIAYLLLLLIRPAASVIASAVHTDTTVNGMINAYSLAEHFIVLAVITMYYMFNTKMPLVSCFVRMLAVRLILDYLGTVLIFFSFTGINENALYFINAGCYVGLIIFLIFSRCHAAGKRLDSLVGQWGLALMFFFSDLLIESMGKLYGNMMNISPETGLYFSRIIFYGLVIIAVLFVLVYYISSAEGIRLEKRLLEAEIDIYQKQASRLTEKENETKQFFHDFRYELEKSRTAILDSRDEEAENILSHLILNIDKADKDYTLTENTVINAAVNEMMKEHPDIEFTVDSIFDEIKGIDNTDLGMIIISLLEQTTTLIVENDLSKEINLVIAVKEKMLVFGVKIKGVQNTHINKYALPKENLLRELIHKYSGYLISDNDDEYFVKLILTLTDYAQ